MAARRKRKKREPAGERGRRGLATKLAYVTVLIAVGAGAGLVLGSITETPRLVLAWLRGPIQEVDLVPVIVDAEDTPLDEFRELQSARPAPPRAPAPRPAPAGPSIVKAPVQPAKPAPVEARALSARVEPPKIEPAPRRAPTPPVSSGVRPIAQGPKTHDQIIAELEARTRPISAPSRPQPKAKARRGPVVQVAAHVSSALAETQAASLRDSGFDAYVSHTRSSANKIRYRVRVRPSAPETAPELVSRLRARGLDTWTTAE